MVLAKECSRYLDSMNATGRDDRILCIPHFRDIIQKLEQTYPPGETLRPALIYSNRYITAILASHDDPYHLLASVNHAIAVLVCIGFKLTDASPVTMKDVASPITIDFSNSYLHYAYVAPTVIHPLLQSLERLNLPQRKESWLRTFKKMEAILSGGGDAFFDAQHKEQLESKIAIYIH